MSPLQGWGFCAGRGPRAAPWAIECRTLGADVLTHVRVVNRRRMVNRRCGGPGMSPLQGWGFCAGRGPRAAPWAIEWRTFGADVLTHVGAVNRTPRDGVARDFTRST